jgi:hypothetical protein
MHDIDACTEWTLLKHNVLFCQDHFTSTHSWWGLVAMGFMGFNFLHVSSVLGVSVLLSATF